MAPKKKGGRGAKAATPAAPPLEGCTIALSGNFPGHSQSALEQDFINTLGATLAKSVNKSTTHLVTTDVDFAKPSAKVKQAQANDLHIVKLAWLEDCLDQATRLSEDDYALGGSGSVPASAPAAVNGSRKRSADDDESQSQPKKKGKAADTNGSQTESNQAVKSTAESKLKTEVANGQTNIAASSDINIPLDETCPLVHYMIYIDDSGVIYDAALNQTNAGHNNNKFYRIQV
jgi:poly [ADP-ribose] polymerase 2/3/4